MVFGFFFKTGNDPLRSGTTGVEEDCSGAHCGVAARAAVVADV